MPSYEYDIRYLEAGLDLLDEYLLSKEIYWPIGVAAPPGEPDLPRLTLGGLLLSLARARAASVSPAQQGQVYKLEARMNEIITKWRVAWEQKASQEFRARLNLWRDFLEEYRQNREGNADRYAYEVQRRVMLTLLNEWPLEVPSAELDLLASLDQMLKAVWVPGDFIWDPILAPSFPAEHYWYLYGRLSA